MDSPDAVFYADRFMIYNARLVFNMSKRNIRKPPYVNTEYTCEGCGKVYINNNSYRAHLRRHLHQIINTGGSPIDTLLDRYNASRPRHVPAMTIDEAMVIHRFNGQQLGIIKRIKALMVAEKRKSLETENEELKKRITELQKYADRANRMDDILKELRQSTAVIPSNSNDVDGISVDELAAYNVSKYKNVRSVLKSRNGK